MSLSVVMRVVLDSHVGPDQESEIIRESGTCFDA